MDTSFFWVLSVSDTALEHLLSRQGGEEHRPQRLKDDGIYHALGWHSEGRERPSWDNRREPAFSSSCIGTQRKEELFDVRKSKPRVFLSLDLEEFRDPDQGESFGSINEAGLTLGFDELLHDVSVTLC